MGELIGLQWGDVDFHGRFIEVRRAVVRGEETDTKNHKIRRVDMSPQLQAELERLKEVQQLDSMRQGLPTPVNVFLSPNGLRWDERNLRRGWYRCLAKAGIRKVRFHDLRHTFVSQLIATGAPSKYVTVQAGHGSSQITQDTYGHLLPDGNRQWISRLDVTSTEALSDTQMIHSYIEGSQVREHLSDKPLACNAN